MKDSMGSVVLINIFIIFIVIYISLMSSIINYTKNFRVKNRIIEIIERNGGYNNGAEKEIEQLFIDAGMGYEGEYPCTEVNEITTKSKVSIKNNLFKCEIEKHGNNKIVGSYYKVVVYVEFSIPLRKESLIIPLTGETKTVREKATDYEPHEVTYYMVDEEFVDPDIDLDLELEESLATVVIPDKACCNKTTCLGGTMALVNGVYKCTNKLGSIFPTSCNLSKPGTEMDSDGGHCCYDCDAKPLILNLNGKTTSQSNTWRKVVSVSVLAEVTDVSNVGYECKIASSYFTSSTYSTSVSIDSGANVIIPLSCINRLGVITKKYLILEKIDNTPPTATCVYNRWTNRCSVVCSDKDSGCATNNITSIKPGNSATVKDNADNAAVCSCVRKISGGGSGGQVSEAQ